MGRGGGRRARGPPRRKPLPPKAASFTVEKKNSWCLKWCCPRPPTARARPRDLLPATDDGKTRCWRGRILHASGTYKSSFSFEGGGPGGKKPGAVAEGGSPGRRRTALNRHRIQTGKKKKAGNVGGTLGGTAKTMDHEGAVRRRPGKVWGNVGHALFFSTRRANGEKGPRNRGQR